MAQSWNARNRGLDEALPPRGVALVVEPDPDKREHAAHALRALGYKTHDTGCGAVAQFIATQIRFDVLVVDVVLPDMNGLQLIKKARALSPDSVIVATSPPGGAWGAASGLAQPAGADVALSAINSQTLSAAIAEGRAAPR